MFWRKKNKPTPPAPGPQAEPAPAPEPSALSAQAVRFDVHSHLLPGVDDGAQSLQDARACVALLAEHGYAGAVVTPHIHPGSFDNDERDLADRFAPFRETIAQEFDGFRLALGAEYMLDERFLDRLYDAPDTLLRFGPDRSLVLIEFLPMVEPANMDDLLTACADRGVRPVFAHVERYDFVNSDRGHDRLASWRQRGAVAQVNIGSLAGQYGRHVQRAARDIWEASLVDLLGTDMHRTERAVAALPAAWEYLAASPCEFDPALQRSLIG